MNKPPQNVIEIGDFSIARRDRQYYCPKGVEPECDHKQLETDDNGEIVRCLKCGVTVSAYWALKMLAVTHLEAKNALQRDRDAIAEDKKEHVFLKAVRQIEHAWRGKMVPLCPHCNCGILPSDNFGGSRVCKELEIRRRRIREANKTNDQLSVDHTEALTRR